MSGSRDTAALQASARTSANIATLSRQSSARPLDAGLRSSMQTRFGHDFGTVRVHAGDAAGRSAGALDARAYTSGSDIVFGSGEYQPQTAGGQRLLAHELAHVVQRRQSGSEAGSEERADRAASQVVRGRTVSPSELGAAGPGIHRQPKGDDKNPPDDSADPSPDIKPITLPWSLIAAQLPQLRPPSLLTPPQPAPIFQLPPLSLGSGPSAASPSGGATLKLPQLTSLPAPSATPGPLAPTVQPGLLTPAPASGGSAAGTPDLPSRIGITDFGQISLGLRFGLPVAPQPIPGTPPERRPQPFPIPGAGPSPLAVSDYQFELLDMSMTGKVPRGFDAVDKGDLIKASFGIVAKYIAPDLVASLAKKVSGKPGADYQFDFTISGDFKGGGITFSVPLGKSKKPRKGSSSP
jgi:hypothetical protein